MQKSQFNDTKTKQRANSYFFDENLNCSINKTIPIREQVPRLNPNHFHTIMIANIEKNALENALFSI